MILLIKKKEKLQNQPSSNRAQFINFLNPAKITSFIKYFFHVRLKNIGLIRNWHNQCQYNWRSSAHPIASCTYTSSNLFQLACVSRIRYFIFRKPSDFLCTEAFKRGRQKKNVVSCPLNCLLWLL